MGSNPTSLADALFSRTQQRVLGLLFGASDVPLHLNELVRRAGVGSGAVQRELGRLVAAGLVLRQVSGRQVMFRANAASPVFEELRSLVRKTSGLADALRHALLPVADRIASAFVFGSVAKGTDTADSDIDLMVIAEALSYGDVYPLLTALESELGRRISPTIYSPADWQLRLEQANAFVTRVRHLPTLPVIGPAPGEPFDATAGKPARSAAGAARRR
jgi:predicted nucleotidyltransferase